MKATFVSAYTRVSAVIYFAILLWAVCQASMVAAQQPSSAVPSLITAPVNESQLTVLKGNTHPIARREFDLGTAAPSLPMKRMLLVLKRSPQQEAALRKMLDDQQDKSSSSYHKWLTPDEFGKQYGPSDADLQTVTAWLQGHGFTVGTTRGRTVLEFSGTAGQVQEAFHTTMHNYLVNGEQHWANANDPSIPTALTPAVAGVLTLHNFLKTPQVVLSSHKAGGKIVPGKRPALTFSDGSHGMSPLDFATIYSSPAFTSGSGGGGVAIGIIGRSNLYTGADDISNFRSNLGVCCGSFNVVLNGPDPGDLGGGEEAEATLDSSWSGAVAPNASVSLVVSASTNTSDGTDLSEIYIIENNLADVMTESFGGCEAASTSAQAAGVSMLAEQAAAQGITYFVSTGDSGAEGCDDPNFETVANGPVSVNVLAATPFNVAVGGTEFNDTSDPTKYWSATNSNQESALSYIPEDVWNDSCASSQCGSTANIAAGGGGSSVFFSKPAWQTGVTGILADNTRDLPDVSLSASTHDGYLLCLEGSCIPNSQGEFFLFLAGGTSASAPSFAGIMALIDSAMATNGGVRQGLANYNLYRLAATQNAVFSQCNGSSTTALPASTCIFNDVTFGNNAVPGELNFGSPNAQYQAGVGYDMASGLGSVNITLLINTWASESLQASTTTLSLNPTTIVHGAPVTVSISVAPAGGTGSTPTGDVSLLDFASAGFYTLSNGSASSSTYNLPGGSSYSVQAYYAGDATYAPSYSNTVSVTVTPEPSTTALSVLTFDANGNQSNFTSGPFGSFVYLRADVAGLSGHGTPTGSVTFTDTNPFYDILTLNSGDQFQNGAYAATPNGILDFDSGTHTISAAYSGDASFNASSSQSITFTVTPGFFVAATSAQPGAVVSAPGSSGVIAFNLFASSGFSGPIALTCSGLPVGAGCNFSPPQVIATGSYLEASILLTVTTTVAAAEPASRPWGGFKPLVAFALGSCALAGLASRNRTVLLLVIAFVILFSPGCGGGGSSTPSPTPTPTGTPKGTYTVNVIASSGSASSTTSFSLFVQ